MPCTDNVCGTGGWAGPLPGDPDNNSVLSAVPAYGGIDLSWTYPNTNPEAVAHIRIYRGTTDNFDWAIQIKIVNGDNFYDRIPANQLRQYFYWIRIISVNGTVGDPIGPATAVPKKLIDETIAELSGKIDVGYLAQSLRGELDEINLLKLGLDKETADRLVNNQTMADALAAVQSETGEALTYIQQEIVHRTEADSALLTTTNSLAVGLGNAAAGLVEEAALRATADSALSTQITTAKAQLGSDIASVKTEMTTGITQANGKIASIGALWTAKVDVNGMVGGFGVYNDGQFVEAGFDVDRFWVGKSTSKIKPFIIDNGVTYINNAAIQDGAITNAKIGNDIRSIDFTAGSSGWRIAKDGSAELNNAVFRGTLNIKSAASGARMEVKNNVIKVFGAAGNLLIRIGDLRA